MLGSLCRGTLVAVLSILTCTSPGSAAEARLEILPHLLRVDAERTASASLARATDDAYWSTDFGNYDLEGSIEALCEWNGRLVAAGNLGRAGNLRLHYFGAWNGEAWEAMPGFGAGMTDSLSTSLDAVIELLPFAGDLIAVGRFYRGFVEGHEGQPYRMRVARWDGTSWTRLGADLRGRVTTAAIHGGELHVGGDFDDEGLASPTSILRWTGTAWEPVAGAPSEGVSVLFDDGASLLAAGTIPTEDDSPGYEVLAFDGVNWSMVGTPACGRIDAIARYEGDLYVGGTPLYGSCGETPATLARLQGDAWVSVGGDLSGSIASETFPPASVRDLEVLDGRLVVTGDFRTAGGITANGLAAWDGTSWSGYGEGLSAPGAVIAPWGDAWAVSGAFQSADGVLVGGLAIRSDQGFRPVRRNQGIDGDVRRLVPTDHGLFVGGLIRSAGGEPVPSITRWTGERFEGLGENLIASIGVEDVVVHEGELYAVGSFQVLEDSTWTHATLVRFDGTKWHAIEIAGPLTFGSRLTSWRGKLILFGQERDDRSFRRFVLGALDGTSFTEIPFVSAGVVLVNFMTVYRDHLIVGGHLSEIEGRLFNNIAAWDGVRWDTLKGGVGGTAHDAIVVDDELVVAGYFLAVGPYVPARGVARWNGERWSSFGEGFATDNPLTGSTIAVVRALAVHHGRLHAAGRFNRSGEAPLNGIARWNGDAWEPLGSGTSSAPAALASWNDALYVGGAFHELGGQNSASIARWDGPPDPGWVNRPRAGVRVDPAVPNPFNPRTSIVFSMARRDHVRVEVVDARGRRVALVFEGIREAGQHRVEWLGTDATGHAVASGVYYVRVRGASGEDAGAVTLLR